MANPPLILIIDDDPNFLEIFSVKLTAEGFRVETALNAEEGRTKTVSLKPNLVLMDVQMPGMNGAEAMMKLKADPATNGVPILFLTALGDPNVDAREIDRRFSKEVGAVGYLKKTDDLNTMAEYIRNFVK